MGNGEIAASCACGTPIAAQSRPPFFVWNIGVSSFEIVSDFEIRISDLIALNRSAQRTLRKS
jgi:hypothetical protein